MDKIPVPEQDVATLDNFAPDVAGMRDFIVNVYVISRSSGEWILVDTGLPHSQGRILRWVEERIGPGARPTYIFMTHGHFDHSGCVVELAREWDVPVLAHPLEMPFLTGESAYPPPDPSVGGGLMATLSKLYPRDPVDLGAAAQTLPADGSVPGFPEWRWIHTPGHTVGHVSLFREQDRALVAGDAFVTTKQESLLAVATQRPELHGPPAYFTTDWHAARDSVERLAALRPATVATGHGLPLVGPEVASALSALAVNFDHVARPQHGTYVTEPAA
jgi:glyoxylase-like metal-dependent hydrolase (beta-lactamase superfamily II)